MLTEAEIDLIVQETRYGIDCPVSGDFRAAVRDAILAGYRAGWKDNDSCRAAVCRNDGSATLLYDVAERLLKPQQQGHG